MISPAFQIALLTKSREPQSSDFEFSPAQMAKLQTIFACKDRQYSNPQRIATFINNIAETLTSPSQVQSFKRALTAASCQARYPMAIQVSSLLRHASEIANQTKPRAQASDITSQHTAPSHLKPETITTKIVEALGSTCKALPEKTIQVITGAIDRN